MFIDHIDGYGGVLFDDVGEKVDVCIVVCKDKLACGFCPYFDSVALFLCKAVGDVIGKEHGYDDNHCCNQEKNDAPEFGKIHPHKRDVIGLLVLFSIFEVSQAKVVENIDSSI